MRPGLYPGEDLDDRPLFIEQKGNPQGTLVLEAHKFSAPPGAKSLDHFT